MNKGSEAITEGLKTQLKLRGLSYRELGRIWQVSESSVKRIMTSGELSTSRIEVACAAMDLPLGDFFRQINFAEQAGLFYLSHEQEKLLARDPEALNYFLLLNEGWSPTEILREYSVAADKNIRILNLLEKWGLIEVHPNNRIKRKFLGNLRFRKEGPLGRQIEKIVKTGFLDTGFDRDDEYFTFLHLNLVPGDLQKFKIRLLEVFKEMTSQSEKNRVHPNSQSYGMTLAMRPWTSPFTSVFTKRKKIR